jgi:hypothetical protein
MEQWLRQRIYYCKVNDLLYDMEKYECLLMKLLDEKSGRKSPVDLPKEGSFDRRGDASDKMPDGISSGRKEDEFKWKG